MKFHGPEALSDMRANLGDATRGGYAFLGGERELRLESTCPKNKKTGRKTLLEGKIAVV
jgi:hypothetical protein